MNRGIRNSQDAAGLFPHSRARQGGHHSLQGEQWMFGKTLHIAGLPSPLGTCLQSAVIITYPFATACLRPDRAVASKPDPWEEAVLQSCAA